MDLPVFILSFVLLLDFRTKTVWAHNQILSIQEIDNVASTNWILLIAVDYFEKNYKHPPDGSELELSLEKLFDSFKSESIVLAYFAPTLEEALLKDDFIHVKFTNLSPIDYEQDEVMVVHRKTVDRSCLYKKTAHSELLVTVYKNDPKRLPNLSDFVSFVNSVCDTYFNVDGTVSKKGLIRKEIMKHLYSVEERATSERISMSALVEICGKNLKHFFYTGICNRETVGGGNDDNMQISLPRCDVIDLSKGDDDVFTDEKFRNEILFRSKPVIIKRLIDRWPARTKWTNEFFRRNFGDLRVHIKVTSSAGVYEGVEPASLWTPPDSFEVPDVVREKLEFPDLVLVRPAGIEMTMNQFMDFIEKTNSYDPSRKFFSNISAYIEYTHIKDYFKEMETDVNSFSFARSLILKHLNFWFSDGNTIGKLHFDEFDNFLCQLKGRKQVILFEPHANERLYEGYIVEGLLSYSNGTFLRNNLLEAVAVTMSPVNIVEPDFQKFPNFASAYPLNCTIDEGDVLFMPAFWWHEVQSYPNLEEKRNLAVNFWYDPYFTKEFPCANCSLKFNPVYRDIF